MTNNFRKTITFLYKSYQTFVKKTQTIQNKKKYTKEIKESRFLTKTQ